MNIAFDLDNTLISSNFPQEECSYAECFSRKDFAEEQNGSSGI